MSRRGLRLAVVAASVLVAFAFSELALRAVLGDRFVPDVPPRRAEEVLGRHDDDLGWSLTPGARARIVAERAPYDVALNSRGFRDAEPAARTPGRRRIVLLGDSYGFGWGVAADESFGALLGRDPRIGEEVVNLCVPGYSTDQELWTLERESERIGSADLVLLEYCANDVEGCETTNSHRMLKPMFVRKKTGEWTVENRPTPTFLPIAAEPPSWGDRTFSWSAIWQVASGRTPLGGTPTVPHATAFASFARDRNPFAAGTASRHAFEELVARSKALGAKLVVFGVPTFGELEIAPVVESGEEYLDASDLAVARLGRELGFTALSIDRAFHDAEAARADIAIPDGHWNAAGHRLAEETLAPRMAALFGPR